MLVGAAEHVLVSKRLVLVLLILVQVKTWTVKIKQTMRKLVASYCFNHEAIKDNNLNDLK
jgi:hypothetical protein